MSYGSLIPTLGPWLSYGQMNIIQKINLKANSIGAAIRFNESPYMQASLMFFALTDFRHNPDFYGSPFHFAKFN